MKAKLMRKNYRRRFTVIIVAALLLAIMTAVGVPLSLRTQIQEARALEQSVQTQGTANGEERHEAEDVWKGQLTPVPTANIVCYCVLGALWVMLLLCYWLEVAGWLYKSAAEANMHPSLWPILGLFFNVFAVFAFLIVRDWPSRAAA
ncbi:MAG: hypothetical protein ACI3XD_05610 [Oscillospiraceae bacterium]